MSDVFRDLCAEVIAYYEGQGKYNFSRLNENDRDNEAFDAWERIRAEIESALLANPVNPTKCKITPAFQERCYDPPMKDLIADPILIGIENQTLAAFTEGDIMRYAISRSDIDEVRCLVEMESKVADPIRTELERQHQYSVAHPEHDTDEIVAAAYTALAAAPAAVAGEPSDEELADTYWEAWHEHHDRTNSVLHSVGLRAVLARWGNHSPGATKMVPPPSDGEVAELVAWLRSRAAIPTTPDFPAVADRLRIAAALLQQQAAELERLRALADEVSALVKESEGVAGLHLNGDIAPWDELLPGGRFESLTSLPSGEVEG